MKNDKNWMTAAELMAKLHADPEWVADMERETAEHQRRVEQCRVAAEPLVAALREAGCEIESLGALTNPDYPHSKLYPQALPVLLAHLGRPYPDNIRALIADSLAVPEAMAHWEELKRRFRDETTELIKDRLAATLASIADKDSLPDVIELARDKRQGDSRILLLSALEQSRDPRAKAALAELADDPDLTLELQAIAQRDRQRQRRRERRRKR